MRATESLSPQELTDVIRGPDADRFIGEGDFTTYLQTYLMPPLAGARAHTGRTANIASSSRARTAGAPSTSRARAAGAPSTSRAWTPKGEVRGMPSTRQCVGWPDPSTELTGWWYGIPYQIPLEPPLPDHRYVRTPGSPPPSVEYVEGLLQVMASFESMIL